MQNLVPSDTEAAGLEEVRNACLVHMYLVNAFIALTEAVLDDLPAGYACESVTESLYQLHRDHASYLSLFKHLQLREAA